MSRPGEIKYIKAHLRDLEVGDVVKIASAHERITELTPTLPGECRAKLVDVITGYMRIIKLGNIHTYMVTGGAKLEATRSNPKLAPVQGAHRVWKGQEAKAS